MVSRLHSLLAPVLVVLTLSIVVLPSEVAAEDETQTIHVDVRSISASHAERQTDEQLDDLRDRLETNFENYRSFRQLDRHQLEIETGETKSVELPGDRTLEVTCHGKVENLIKLEINVVGKLSTTVRASPGSTFFQAGLKHEDGMLVLAITVDD